MSDLASSLLSQLKDYTKCNDDLAILIRQTILEPFQLDLSQPDALRRPSPSPTRFKQMATKLAPLAMRIVNQNIEGLVGIKRATTRSGNYVIAVNCLVDTSFYALTALRHMSSYTTLKPLDIEKTTSNLICKMVELGEYNRALDEIQKFRLLLASVAKVQLDAKKPATVIQKATAVKNVLTESSRNNQSQVVAMASTTPVVPESIIKSQWEDGMLTKYQDLFQFPLDPSLEDRTIILLVLAYQMNTLRCWCEINEGILSKYVPYFMERPGNFFDWCKQLLKIDPTVAKKQLDTFQRLLYKAVNRFPSTEEVAFHSHHVQNWALKALILSKSVLLKSITDRVVRIGITYEKSAAQVNYSYLQEVCKDFLEAIQPNTKDRSEMDSYFVLCEYYAYVSRKSKSYKGAFYAYKHMIRPLIPIIEGPCGLYYAAYAANAKLALGSIQMDKIVLDDTYADISTTLNESISCLRLLSPTLEPHVQDQHNEQALLNLCKSIDNFRSSAKRLYELISEKKKQGYRTPPPDLAKWDELVVYLNSLLQQCGETLPTALNLAFRHKAIKRVMTTTEVMVAFIDIMVLLARMQFNLNDDMSYQQSYDYLSTAEQLCAEKKFFRGYRYLSGSYYNIGTALIKTNDTLYRHAVYPLRKACSLLEKDSERAQSDEGRLQLCKRYEILGVCCHKNKQFEDSVKAYRLALKRLPVSTVDKFIRGYEMVAVSRMMTREPLLSKLMDRYLRASVSEPEVTDIHFASEFVQMAGLSAIQQSFVYECELKIWYRLSFKMDVSRFQLFIVNRLLQVYDAVNYPIRRARVLLHQIRIERSKRGNREEGIRAALACSKEALSLLNIQNYGQDSNLLNYRLHYLGLASSWVAICSRELKQEAPNTLEMTLQQWNLLLEKIKPLSNSKNKTPETYLQRILDEIDDVEQFYDHLRMLADLFAINGEYIHEILALRLLLKLNTIQASYENDEHDPISESVMIMSRIGKLYSELGYTGKASLEFIRAHQLLIQGGSKIAEIVYRTHYSFHLLAIGDVDTSKEIFESTKVAWRDVPAPRDLLATVRNYTQHRMLLADAYLTLSYIRAQTVSLDDAIQTATAALQLLNKCIKVVQESHEKPTSAEKNPFMPNAPAEREITKLVFRESQWMMACQTSRCLIHLADLYMRKGTGHETKYFVKQAPLLAQKVMSPHLFFKAFLCASEFYWRSGDLERAQTELENANRAGLRGLDEIRLKMMIANLAIANKFHEVALRTCDEAYHLVEKLMTKPPMLDEDETNDDAYECLVLQRVQSSIVLLKASIMIETEALDLLEKTEESGIPIEDEIEFNTALSRLKLRDVPDTRDIKVIPKMKLTRGMIGQRKAVDMRSQDSLTIALERLLEAYQVGSPNARAHILQTLCQTLAGAIFLKSRVTNDDALLSSFYLSMSNGIYVRREMQACLKIKQGITLIPNETEWPSFYEQPQRYAKLGLRDSWLQTHLKTLSERYEEESLPSTNEECGDSHQLLQDKFVNILPEHWTVCSVTLMQNALYVVQLRRKETPFVLRLPLDRHKGISYEEALAELRAIIQGSDETIHNSLNCTEKSAIEAWWKRRKELDTRLKTLLEKMEQDWLSGFKGILSARAPEFKEELTRFQRGLSECVHKLVKAVIPSLKQVDFSLALCRVILRLGRYPTPHELDDVTRFLVLTYGEQQQQQQQQQTTNELESKVDYKKLTEQMRVLLGRYHEKCSMAGIDSCLKKGAASKEHVILILDKHLQMFPIESLPTLRAQSSSRLPCLSFLRDRILYVQAQQRALTTDWQDLKVSKRSAYYVLNPGGDLRDTQRAFEPLFKSVPDWDGVIQTTPMELECRRALESYDVYMYFGHSAGQAFMRGTTVRQMPKCAVSLLMGCSSGVLESNGQFESYGYVLNYLLAGSPAVVANLWDVTDRSIDRLTKHMLNAWGMTSATGGKSIVQAVAESRNQCSLPYLIGAAPVVYGIPVYTTEDIL